MCLRGLDAAPAISSENNSFSMAGRGITQWGRRAMDLGREGRKMVPDVRVTGCEQYVRSTFQKNLYGTESLTPCNVHFTIAGPVQITDANSSIDRNSRRTTPFRSPTRVSKERSRRLRTLQLLGRLIAVVLAASLNPQYISLYDHSSTEIRHTTLRGLAVSCFVRTSDRIY